MLKKRLIPKLLIKKQINNKKKKNLVFFNSENFKKLIVVGDPVSQAKFYQSQKADELIIFFGDKKNDIRSSENVALIKKFSTEIFSRKIIIFYTQLFFCFICNKKVFHMFCIIIYKSRYDHHYL